MKTARYRQFIDEIRLGNRVYIIPHYHEFPLSRLDMSGAKSLTGCAPNPGLKVALEIMELTISEGPF